MINSIKKLYDISQKKSRLILGLMSGTSLDGLDIALCRVSHSGQETKLDLLQFTTLPYNATFKNELLSICFKENIETEKLCLLHNQIGNFHALLVNESLNKWNIHANEIDLIASHGQTVYHSPKSKHQLESYGNATFQMGDADQIAVKTGIITISDFRQKHIASGGEGAPLAAYGDFLLFADNTTDRILLNIGGIANCTYLPAGKNIEKIISSDLGPGNTLMDNWCRKYYNGISFDKDGALAKKGKVNAALLEQLHSHPFFKNPFPKSTGPEDINLDWVERCKQKLLTTELSNEDMLATLNAFTAEAIVEGINQLIASIKNVQIFVSGGGLHNLFLMEQITRRLSSHQIKSTNALNIPPDAKEAILFALLANETVAGNLMNKGQSTEKLPLVSMGKISFPD